ncbi:VWA domain-containing protein [Lysinibacillus sp. NPDC096418]|uniref:vWA domain-containing protein n=1 Tax=Lysinibacillus sp. NPDC096418 TaxID=3364138 RepID=UPI00382AAAB2
MNLRISALTLVICAGFLIGGCSPPTDMKDKPIETKGTATTDNTVPSAPRTLDEMIQQKSGLWTDKYIDEETELGRGVNVLGYLGFHQNNFTPILHEELPKYFKDKAELTTDELYDHLLYLLGSGKYIDYYEDLQNWQYGFTMPVLPTGPDDTETVEKSMNVILLLDASGSMKAKVPGGMKMELAKEAVHSFAKQLKPEANVSLFAYGHVDAGTDQDKTKSCETIEDVYPLQPYDENSFITSLNSFQASGWTPLAGAIEKAHDLLKAYPENENVNIVFIVSDGVETCNGNLIDAAKLLQASNIQVKVNIIGLDVGDKGQAELKKVADAGNGDYVTLQNKDELETYITKKWKPIIGQLVFITGPSGREYLDVVESLIRLKDLLTYAAQREKMRIDSAISILHQEKLISVDQKTQLLNLTKDMYEGKHENFSSIYETKKKDMDSAADEIKTKVDEWKEQFKD